ncbi:MAG: hypothetical protein ACI97A_001866 [Planctomycetota bacterium]|jgi:hypothetical protein
MRVISRMIRFPKVIVPLLLLIAPNLFAQDKLPSEIPAIVKIEATTKDIAATGRFDLHFAIEVKGEIKKNYKLAVILRANGVDILNRTHVPLKGTSTWKSGEIVQYTLPTLFPMEADLGDAKTIVFWACFVDPKNRRFIPCYGSSASRDPFDNVGYMPTPKLDRAESEEDTAAMLTNGLSLLKSGNTMAAWDVLEFGLRRSQSDRWKKSFLDAMLSIKKLAPRPLNGIEDQIIAKRIADEKTRYLRQRAGRLFDRKYYHASIAILDAIGGTLQEAGDAAVMGDINEAERRDKSKQDTKRMILEAISPDQLQLARKETDKLVGEKLLKRAEHYVKKDNLPVARHLLRELRLEDDADLRRRAYAMLEAVKTTMLESMPSEQRTMVKAAVDHPCWGRTTTRITQNFILIGPERLLSGITDESALRFDVAYVLITDLFGRLPNPDGDRVTVYFKELWDFGGGTGGGKTINIGRADPKRENQRLDTGLFYHEFTHCVDDTSPIIKGWREGLADFGAVYAFDLIGQKTEAKGRFKEYAQAFKADYLDRDLEFWRISNYAPSAGFFTHFVQSAAKKNKGKRNWQPYREFFRNYRDIKTKDGREQAMVRNFAFNMMVVFGDWVFDDLLRFRFPLIDTDRDVLKKEAQAYHAGFYDEFEDIEAHGKYPNSPLPRDLVFRELMDRVARIRDNDEEVQSMAAEELGVIMDWRVIGPFESGGADPLSRVYPPEWEQDFSKKYISGANVCTWLKPSKTGPVFFQPHGWLDFKFNYQDNTAIYALSHVSTSKPQDVVVHLRADDDVALFLNEKLIGQYTNRGMNGSTRSSWRGPHAKIPDAIHFGAKLGKGRNKLLVKIKNRHGASGLICAITQVDGTPLPLLMSDNQPPTESEKTVETKWKKPIKMRFASRGSERKFDRTVGRLGIVDKALVGTDRGGRVAWRKYTVRPGFPKDSPSNLFWLKKQVTKGMRDFQLKIELQRDGKKSPKLGICFDGDGGKDGLGGLTLIIHPADGDKLRARLERYDRLVYASDLLKLPPLPKKGSRTLRVERLANKVSVHIDDVKIFDLVDIRPITKRDRLGFMTWSPDTRIKSIDLRMSR